MKNGITILIVSFLYGRFVLLSIIKKGKDENDILISDG